MKFSRNLKILQSLLELGTDKIDSELKVYVQQSNLNGLIYFFVDLILSIVFYFVLDDAHISIGLLVSGIFFIVSSIGFNSLGWTSLSRLSTVSIGTLLVVYCAFYLGAPSFTAASILLGAIFPFVYFSIEEKRLIALSLTVPIIGYALLIATDYTLGPKIDGLSPNATLWLRSIFFLIPFTGIVVNTYTAVAGRDRKAKTLKESQKLLETIFYALSHDLANPMQTIAIISQMAEKSGSMPPDKITKLNTSSQQMVRIFKNLKSIAQTSMDGKIALNLKDFRIADLIEDSVKFIKDQAATKNVTIEVDLAGLPREVQAQVDKDIFVFQILTNFLTNSLKFTDSGQKILIKATVTESGKAQIVIRDWGRGIEPARLKKLFSWSDRTSTIGTQGEKGTGLGLPLAMKFLASMNGSLSIKSFHFEQYDESSRGTEITLLLPFSESQKIPFAA